MVVVNFAPEARCAQGMMTWLLAIPAVVCGSGTLYQWIGTRLAASWLREIAAIPALLPAVTLLRPLKTGVPGLQDKLERLARALRPGDQLVLGAAEGSAELAACLELIAQFPEAEIVAVPCRDGAATNPKISKLVQMDAACRHEHCILSDSEAVIDGPWLDALRGEWVTSGTDVLTTAYRFVGARTWPERCDVAATLLSLWPGLAIVRRWGKVDFTLGACTALRRSDLLAVGGWRAFDEFLAEDRQLGLALVAAGRRIRLASAITTLDADPLQWRDWWLHQRRVATTYRFASPGGFAGTFLTHSFTAALLLVAVAIDRSGHLWAIGWAAVSCLARWLAAWQLARLTGFPSGGLLPAMFAAGLMESVTWLLSWGATRVWWSGRWWRLEPRGRLVAAAPVLSP